MRILISLLLFISLAFDGVGQIGSDSLNRKQSGSAVPITRITGIVVDSISKKPIPFCSIALYNSDNQQVIAGIVDENGVISLTFSMPGIYSLGISNVGYSTLIITNIHGLKQARVIDLGKIVLVADTKQLEEVVVTGQRDLIEDKGDRLVYNAEKDISNMGGSAADVLRKVPMLAVDLNGNVQLRGSKNFRIFLNGKPSALMAQNPADALRQIPGSTIKSVEVITSPGAKYDAEGTAGIINIITIKKWGGFYGSAYGSVGNLYQSLGSSVNVQGKKFGISIGGGAYQYRSIGNSDFFRTTYQAAKPISELYQRSEWDNIGPGGNLGINLDYDPDSTSRFNLWLSGWGGNAPNNSALYSRLKANDGKLIEEFSQDIQLSDSYLIGEVNMGYTKKFRNKKKLYSISPSSQSRESVGYAMDKESPGPELALLMQYNQMPGRNSYQSDQYSPFDIISYRERSINHNKFNELTFQSDYTYPFSIGKKKNTTKSTLEVGAKAIFRDIGSDYSLEKTVDNSVDYLVDPSRSSKFDYTQQVVSGYLSLQLIMLKYWVLTTGARLESTHINGNFVSSGATIKQQYQNLIPNFSLSRKFKDIHTFRISYTQRITRPLIRYLNPFVNYSNPLSLTTGNPNLDPELAHATELTHSVYIGKNIFLNSALFLRYTNNAIENLSSVDTLGVSINSPQNVARRTLLGFQANISIKPNKKLSISGGGTIQNFNSYSEALRQGNQGVTGNITGNFSYTFEKGFSMQLNGNYNSGLVTLQGSITGWYGYGLALKQSILNGNGSLTFVTNTPFNKVIRQTDYQQALTFSSYSYSANVTRSAMLSFYWQFGEYISSKKQTRIITNDDKSERMKRK